MHENAYSSIYIFKIFSGGDTPGPPLTRGGEGKGGGEGRGRRDREGRSHTSFFTNRALDRTLHYSKLAEFPTK
jgi:hypothetical protein